MLPVLVLLLLLKVLSSTNKCVQITDRLKIYTINYKLDMMFESCINESQNDFTITNLVDNGIISASSANTPSWVLVGGLLASSFVSCITSDYWWGNPLQPITSNNLQTIFNEDNAQIGSVINLLYDLYGELSQLNDNFSFINQALKFDILEIL